MNTAASAGALTPVTDHALVRYLERVKGLDIQGFRAEIGKLVAGAVHLGQPCSVQDGFIYVIEDGAVITVLPRGTTYLKSRRDLPRRSRR